MKTLVVEGLQEFTNSFARHAPLLASSVYPTSATAHCAAPDHDYHHWYLVSILCYLLRIVGEFICQDVIRTAASCVPSDFMFGFGARRIMGRECNGLIEIIEGFSEAALVFLQT